MENFILVVLLESLDVQGENQRFGLYWLYLIMSLLKALFLELRISPGVKT
jgi:hypothetical protein